MIWNRVLVASTAIIAVATGILSLGHFLQARGALTDWLSIGPFYNWAIEQFRTEFLSRVFPHWLAPFLDGIAHVVAHIIRSLLLPFHIDWTLRPDWKDIVVPLWLYFGRNALANRNAKDEQIVARAYGSLNKAARANLPTLPELIQKARSGRQTFFWILLLWGLFAALLIATATGLTPAEGSSLLSLGLFLIFFVLYELGSNALVATLVPYVGETWLRSFRYHLKRTRQNMGLGATVAALAFALWLMRIENTDGALALLIFLYIMFLGLRDCLNPIRDLLRDAAQPKLWDKWINLQERAQFQLGRSVLTVIFGVIAAIVSKI
ncbi:MAG: hypothetical protein ABL883_08110 [Terricaulis sp.]